MASGISGERYILVSDKSVVQEEILIVLLHGINGSTNGYKDPTTWCLYIYLSIYLPIYLSIYLLIYLIYLIYLSNLI